MSTVVTIHPRHASAGACTRRIWPTMPADAALPEIREFLLRRLLAGECKRRKVSPQDHETAKRMALAALRHGASADCARRVAMRFLDAVAPRRRLSIEGSIS